MLSLVPRRVTIDSAEIFVGVFGRAVPPRGLALAVEPEGPGPARTLPVTSFRLIDGGGRPPIFAATKTLERLPPRSRFRLTLRADGGSDGTQSSTEYGMSSPRMHVCPADKAMFGLHQGKNDLLCAD